jgi:DNA adenine methylase
MTDRLRSPIICYGGKGILVSRLLPLVPSGGRPYVEPYCGGASLFFARDPAPVEVLNDRNDEIVNIYRCLQNRDTFEELRHRLMYTPYARAEFIRALSVGPDADPVTRAWATFVRMNMGINGMASTPGNWCRSFVSRGGISYVCHRWLMRLAMLDAFRWRLMTAMIDNRDAIEVIRYWDSDETVFYIDPPYHPDTRKDKHVYTTETDHEHHEQLVQTILRCKGAVVVSGYAHSVYEPLEQAGWERIDFRTSCYAAGRVRGSGLQGEGAASRKVPRTETVWRNPKAVMLAPAHRAERKDEDDTLFGSLI